MRPAPDRDPYPLRGRRVRSDALYIARAGRPAVHAAVVRVLTEQYPRRRSAGMLQVLVFLAVASLYCPSGVLVGHAELSARFGVSRRTLVSRLAEWRNDHRMLDRKRRGRRNASVTHWCASAELVREVATELRGRTDRHGKRLPPKVSELQGANNALVAAPTGRPGRAEPAPGTRIRFNAGKSLKSRRLTAHRPIAEVLAELYRRD